MFDVLSGRSLGRIDDGRARGEESPGGARSRAQMVLLAGGRQKSSN